MSHHYVLLSPVCFFASSLLNNILFFTRLLESHHYIRFFSQRSCGCCQETNGFRGDKHCPCHCVCSNVGSQVPHLQSLPLRSEWKQRTACSPWEEMCVCYNTVKGSTCSKAPAVWLSASHWCVCVIWGEWCDCNRRMMHRISNRCIPRWAESATLMSSCCLFTPKISLFRDQTEKGWATVQTRRTLSKMSLTAVELFVPETGSTSNMSGWKCSHLDVCNWLSFSVEHLGWC